MANILQMPGYYCAEPECENKNRTEYAELSIGYNEITLCESCLKELAITIKDYLEFLEE